MQSPAALPESPPPSHPERPARGDWWAVCLCAAWCGTCGIYRPLFDELARAHPDVRFEWVDIEDESDISGDLDVETFPTLLIADGERALFLGPCCPRRPCWRGFGQLAGRSTGQRRPRWEAQQVFERVRAARGA